MRCDPAPGPHRHRERCVEEQHALCGPARQIATDRGPALIGRHLAEDIGERPRQGRRADMRERQTIGVAGGRIRVLPEDDDTKLRRARLPEGREDPVRGRRDGVGLRIDAAACRVRERSEIRHRLTPRLPFARGKECRQRLPACARHQRSTIRPSGRDAMVPRLRANTITSLAISFPSVSPTSTRPRPSAP